MTWRLLGLVVGLWSLAGVPIPAQVFENGGPVLAKNFYTLNLGASVAENPTVSIIPVQGGDFTKRILTPMDETKFDFLGGHEVEPAIVLRLMAGGLAVESDGKRRQLQKEAERYPPQLCPGGCSTRLSRRGLSLAWPNQAP